MFAVPDRVPSLNEIVTGAEGIEASQIGAAFTTEATVAIMLTYKNNTRSEQRKPAEQKNQDQHTMLQLC